MNEEKLMTLRDLENKYAFSFDNSTCRLLRQLVIKWIKELKLEKTTLSNGLPETDERYEKYYLDKSKVKPIIFVLKYIFNITDEDLK
ncbi:hypothetical protein LCGC14_1351710 [marine sediment metagenome]|uniref:Uncharacterized protein n=1 Tax=marine sediment metagenome TaxID=412755 RepID=A0A0F9ND21_9ZZZZ